VLGIEVNEIVPLAPVPVAVAIDSNAVGTLKLDEAIIPSIGIRLDLQSL
jgi:hypothetical protein